MRGCLTESFVANMGNIEKTIDRLKNGTLLNTQVNSQTYSQYNFVTDIFKEMLIFDTAFIHAKLIIA